MKKLTIFLLLIMTALFISLIIRGGQVLTVMAISQTNSSAVTVNISDEVPIVAPLTCYDTDDDTVDINLVAGAQRYVKCNTTASDPNGAVDMVTFIGQISTGGATACTADNRNCYANNSCANTTLNATAYKVECSYNFWYNADNTTKSGDWTGNITVVDNSGLSAGNTDTIDVSELLAIGVDAILAFGSKAVLTNDSTTTTAHTIYNYGNIQLDFQTNGTVLTCDTSQIAPEWLAVNLTNGGDYAVSYFVTGALGGPETGNEFDSFNLNENNTATSEVPTPPQKDTYWGIGIPSGVQGDCEGIIWFGALAS